MSFEIKNDVEVMIGNIPCIITRVRAMPMQTDTIECEDMAGNKWQVDSLQHLQEFQITAIQKP